MDALKAIEGDHGDIMNDLLEKGASVTAKGTLDSGPLHVLPEVGKTRWCC